MATRKRARVQASQFQGDDPRTPALNEAYADPLLLSVDSLAEFMEIEEPNRDNLGQALQLAKAAAETATGRPVGPTASHGIRHGIHMLAAQLLIKNQLDATPQPADIPAVVRYLWKTADAGR